MAIFAISVLIEAGNYLSRPKIQHEKTELKEKIETLKSDRNNLYKTVLEQNNKIDSLKQANDSLTTILTKLLKK